MAKVVSMKSMTSTPP